MHALSPPLPAVNPPPTELVDSLSFVELLWVDLVALFYEVVGAHLPPLNLGLQHSFLRAQRVPLHSQVSVVLLQRRDLHLQATQLWVWEKSMQGSVMESTHSRDKLCM